MEFSSFEPNETILVNNEEVKVNKYLLALFSPVFERHFFPEGLPVKKNIELDEGTTVEDFKRMCAALVPQQRQLDDDSLEAVIILARRFMMQAVTEACKNFLVNDSTRCKIWRFRIAHKYGWDDTAEAMLRSLQLDDFSAQNFVENMMECRLLEEEVLKALLARVKLIANYGWRVVSERKELPNYGWHVVSERLEFLPI